MQAVGIPESSERLPSVAELWKMFQPFLPLYADASTCPGSNLKVIIAVSDNVCEPRFFAPQICFLPF